MTKRRFIIFILMLVAVLPAFADGASFTLVPPRTVIQGRNFALTYRLVNAEANAPSAPELDGCSLLFGPAMSTMHSTEIINGRISTTRTVDYTYTYRAEQPGTVTVPELSVRTADGTLRARSASFEILPADNAGSGQSASSSGSSQSGHSGRPNPGKADSNGNNGGSGRVSADDLMVRVFFSKNTVYEQEPVVATIKVYTRYDISSFIARVQPAFEGFLTEELPVAAETTLENFNGRNYHCAVLKKLLLYPQRSGRLEVNTGRYDVTIVEYETVNMGFFRTQRPVERDVTTTSNAAAITVKPLPAPAPAGFAGAVGSFTARTQLDPELLRTNEAATYSYIIEGTGNIKYLSEPAVEFPTGIESYTPHAEIDARVVGGTNMRGTYKTDFTIVPQEVGNFTIAGTPLVYFNPESGQYRTVEVPSMDVRVLRGTGDAAVPQQNNLDATIDDIFHIHASTDRSASESEAHYVVGNGLYWLTYLLLAVILVGIIIVYRRSIRLRADVSGRKLAKAGRTATKRLKKAATLMKAGKSEEFYAATASALWGYISDKLSIAPSQLTRENVAGKLADYGIDEAAAAKVMDVLDNCEMARFTPMGSDSQMNALYDEAAAAIAAIENSKKRSK